MAGLVSYYSDMGKLTLYGIDVSDPVRAVKLTLAALELPYKFVLVNILEEEQFSEEYLKKNPQHTVPMLEDDGATLWDSHAIICYLVSKYGKTDALYPKDLLKRAVVDQRLHFESSVVFTNALRSITTLVLFEGKKTVPRERIDAIIDVYKFMDTFLKDHDYIAGDSLTVADFSLITSVTSCAVYLPIDAATYPKVTAWIKRLQQLPYYGENDKGVQEFLDIMKDKTFTVEA